MNPILQIIAIGGRIVGKAFAEAGRQAIKNARSSPQALGTDASGVGHATTGSVTDQLTRQHRMTLDEAQLILNVKQGEEMEKVLQNYQHLFKANSPPEPRPVVPNAKPHPPPSYSHYLQSKVVRARERIEAEREAVQQPPLSSSTTTTTPPSDPPTHNTS